MEFQVRQMDLILAINKELDKQAKAQKVKLFVEPRRFNTIIEAVNLIVAAYDKPITMASPSMGLTAWLASDDTGTSSKTMAAVLCDVHLDKRQWSHPLDNSDLGRCLRFLEAVPEARPKLERMGAVSKVWATLVKHWDELAKMYQADPTSRALYDRMKELGC